MSKATLYSANTYEELSEDIKKDYGGKMKFIYGESTSNRVMQAIEKYLESGVAFNNEYNEVEYLFSNMYYADTIQQYTTENYDYIKCYSKEDDACFAVAGEVIEMPKAYNVLIIELVGVVVGYDEYKDKKILEVDLSYFGDIKEGLEYALIDDVGDSYILDIIY